MKKIIMLAVWLVPSLAFAQSGLMAYQGRLLDASGNPVTGTQSITFSIYGSGTGGTALWTETQNVQLTNGFYAIQLGLNGTLQSAFDGSPRWLGVKVGNDPEMTPLQFIATVPYAFRALSANSAANASNATSALNATNVVPGGNVNTTSVSANTITISSTPLRIPGLVLGGYTVTSSNCGSSGCTYTCSGAWGDGVCSGSSGSCNGGTRPAGYVRGTARSIYGGTVLCIQ